MFESVLKNQTLILYLLEVVSLPYTDWAISLLEFVAVDTETHAL